MRTAALVDRPLSLIDHPPDIALHARTLDRKVLAAAGLVRDRLHHEIAGQGEVAV
ncbi:hypothetical protein [Roseomonas sp. HF4]|uniref:hypothetical protein n=1 Tax=Roseomonas sp. HF4 TaxID=2562313 RepID=UPI001485C35B|nr:hypothetical protein [Roseomonas sp. HF4]